MKLSRCILLSLAAAMSTQADLTVVSGNVYDVGKYSFIRDITGSTDGAMCWAAAAANVIQHWQDTYISLADDKDSVPNGTTNTSVIYPRGSGELNVYNAILAGWYSGSGVPYNVFSWWMQGPTPGGLGSRYNGVGAGLKNQDSSGGYYKNLFGSGSGYMPVYPSLKNAPFYSLQIDKFKNQDINPQISDVCTTLKNAFKVQGQAVSLLVQPTAGGSGHAISCWGYEEDANGNITSLILTDSDDKKFGSFMVNLAEGSGNSAIIQTDRYNSWYHGDYTIKDVVYITTPTEKAFTREEQAAIDNLENEVLHSGQLTKAVETSKQVIIGGGTYASGADEAVLFTSAADANISIDGGQMLIKDGGMALLYGGLTVKNSSGSGVVADGHLYIHGGAVDIEDCRSSESGGGIQATDTYGEDIYAVTYVEMKGAGGVNLSSNTSSTQARAELATNIYEYYNAGGGAVYAEDSLSIRDSGNITIEDNRAEGFNVHGGGIFAKFSTVIDGNGDVSVSRNSTVATEGYVSNGGGIAGMYIDVSQNKAVDFSGNSVTLTNETAKGWIGASEGLNIYEGGASAAGGAIAVHPYVHLSYYDMMYRLVAVSTKLNMDDNDSVSFKGNGVSVLYTGDISKDIGINTQPCSACGGAVYLGYDVVDNAFIGTEASISRNQGNVTFSNNSATSSATRIEEYNAQGGAVYISTASSLTIDSNKGQVSFTENSVAGFVAQGGAIYNAGILKITNNGGVEFSDNTAAEGSHLYNAMGATAEIAWNESVLFSAENAQNSTVLNMGTMYLAAEEGQSITFHNTTLNTWDGTLYLGKDAAGNEHATTLSFTGDASGQTPAPRTDVSSLSGLPTELSGLSLSLNSISSKLGGGKVSVDDLNVSTDTDLVVNGLVLGSNVQLAEKDEAHALTLSNVVVDLGNTKYTVQENERGGKNYIFDLQSMLSGNITLSGITFDASSFLEPLDFINKDSVCMMFGDVDFSQKEGSSITLAYVGWSTQSGGYVMDGSNVYFGEYFEVPEPATGTLSLLALTLLAARRRRK